MCVDCIDPTDKDIEQYKDNSPFPDVNLDDNFYYCIAIGKKEKMVTGYGDGLFYADKKISRKEAVSVLLRQIKIRLNRMPPNFFKDVHRDDWAKDYLYTGYEQGLITHIKGNVSPDEEITRGEFAMMASKIYDSRRCKIAPFVYENEELMTNINSQKSKVDVVAYYYEEDSKDKEEEHEKESVTKTKKKRTHSR